MIKYTENGNLIVDGRGKLIVKSQIKHSCYRCKRVIVSIDAEYDFSNVPVQYHDLFIRVIGGSCINILGAKCGCLHSVEDVKEEPEKLGIKSLFKRLIRHFLHSKTKNG